MKNKIRNTEMEYIARANCRVDSSFLADGSGRVIGALVLFFCFFYTYNFIVSTPGITVLHEDVFSLHVGRCSRVSEEFSFQTYKRSL